MKKIDEKLVRYVEKKVLPCYSGNDDGHGISHIKKVIDNSL